MPSRRLFGGICGVVILIILYVSRVQLHEMWSAWRAPVLPPAVKFQETSPSPAAVGSGQTSLIEGGVATSQHFMMVSAPALPRPVFNPFATSTPLPAEMNLDVPFTSQAPFGDWALPYQETCEEASMIMVDGFYRKISGAIPPVSAKRSIDDVVAYEKKTFGDYRDTDAATTAKILKGYFGYTEVVVAPFNSVEDLKRVLANGYPVMIPASGKLLPNPNFRNGGPAYHMVVVKGYTKDSFITNDPGTRLGANFVYAFADLLHAAHDWNDGDVLHGAPVMLIVAPKS